MTMYRKLPIEVEAKQFFPGKKPHPTGIEEYECCRTEDVDGTHNSWFGWRINTLEGPQEVRPGDWIITGIAGEIMIYPCKPDIFEQTYEKVE